MRLKGITSGGMKRIAEVLYSGNQKTADVEQLIKERCLYNKENLPEDASKRMKETADLALDYAEKGDLETALDLCYEVERELGLM